MNYFKYLLSFSVISLISIQVNSQSNNSNDEISINKVLITMFDGMREADSAKVASVFRKDVRMFSTYKKETGEFIFHKSELFDFLKAIGTPHAKIWDERISNTIIQIDGILAQVWTVYTFYLGENFSHCGVDAFQLVKENDTWKIINLIDTRRREDCK